MTAQLSIIEEQGGKNSWTPKAQAIFLAEKLGMTDYANSLRKEKRSSGMILIARLRGLEAEFLN